MLCLCTFKKENSGRKCRFVPVNAYILRRGNWEPFNGLRPEAAWTHLVIAICTDYSPSIHPSSPPYKITPLLQFLFPRLLSCPIYWLSALTNNGSRSWVLRPINLWKLAVLTDGITTWIPPPEKHLLNTPQTLVVDSLKGLATLNPNVKLDEAQRGG